MNKTSRALALGIFLLSGCQLQVTIEESIEAPQISSADQAPIEEIIHLDDPVDPRYLKFTTNDREVSFTVHRAEGYFLLKSCASQTRCGAHEFRLEVRPEHEFYDILKQAFHPREFELRSPASLYWAHHHWLMDQGWPTMNIAMPSPDYSVTFNGVVPDPVPDAFVCKVGRKADTLTDHCQSLSAVVNRVRMTQQGAF